ncbi:uncharacterized protein CDAR_280521 [Caerostris darwini]|uniref:Uncharacterized protein n=1 Tax=Caerostris darwini TaxID=1538125 RepID=A0AAV4MDJ2_9ARAC|nr:uncharacterized protein CDAR_280521 [Caerostris darwini]
MQKPKSNHEELESSLKRRRLLNKDHPKGMISKPPLEDDQTEEPPEYEDYFDSLHSRHPHEPTGMADDENNTSGNTKSPTSRGKIPVHELPKPGRGPKPTLPVFRRPGEDPEFDKEWDRKMKHVEELHKKMKAARGEEDVGNHQAVPGTTARPRKDPTSPNVWHKLETKGQIPPKLAVTSTRRSDNISEPTATPLEEECTPPGKV